LLSYSFLSVVLCGTNNQILTQHAHVSMGEVIGLLGGTYEEEEKVLKVSQFMDS